MPNIDHHAPGTFAWIELATTDQAAAKTFYSSLFGWKPNDFPMGPNEFYTMFQLERRDAAACYGMNAEMRAAGLHPHWAIYVAVTNADETAAKVSAAGGKVIKAPFDVFTYGRMAVLQDPAGAYFCIWQAMQNFGTGITGIPGTLCWADLSTPDPAGAAEFYRKVLGWKTSSGPGDTGYLHIENGDQMIGGIPPVQYRDPKTPPHWLSYFLVADCDASTNKA